MKQSTSLTTKEIDEKIEKILNIKEAQKRLDTEVKSLQREIELQYQLPNDQPEILRGKSFYVEKAPTDLGKNNYDIELLKPILSKTKKGSSIIKKVEILDIKALDTLVKEGIIDESEVNACRISRWTFKSLFRRSKIQ